MATPNTTAKVVPAATTVLPNVPRKVGPTKGDLLADLHHQVQVDDSTSEIGSGSSVDSRTGGRRRNRRRNNKAIASTMGPPKTIPRMAEAKPVRLQLGLNLDVELELKAKLRGDVSLTLLWRENPRVQLAHAIRVEKKHTPRPPTSSELRLDRKGEASVEEMFFLRVGTLKLYQRWIDREVSPSLTGAVMMGIAAAGFLAGFATSRLVDSWLAAAQAVLSL